MVDSEQNSIRITDETTVIQQYQALINKLIPFQQENRLLEGLNKFSSVLPSNVRNIIKEEVIRLTSLTDASADNSEFATFPVLKFKHFGIPMRLDRVGQEILQRETERYLDRYTVGVFESVMNSDYYKSHLNQEQQRKIAKAFSVESQSFQDIDFAEDLAIRPNFTVYCSEFENGKHCALSSFSVGMMQVETKRTPSFEKEGKTFTFTFPKVPSLTERVTDITFELQDMSFNKAMLVFETSFVLSARTPKRLRDSWNKYLEQSINHFPLQRELEIERVMQDLERDRILANSPWIPLFLSENDGNLCPSYELITPVSSAYNSTFSPRENLPTGEIFTNLIKELEVHDETFLLTGLLKSKSRDFMVAITHRQAARAGLLKQFVEQASRTGNIQVIQLRLQPILEAHKAVAFDIHDIIANDYPEMQAISHILFCKDVSEWLGDLKILEPEPMKPFPKLIIDGGGRWKINVVMEEQADRRKEPRYKMDKVATIKTGLFNQTQATLCDLSTNGLKLELTEPIDVNKGDTLKISVKELNMSGQKYEVVDFNSELLTLHLKLSSHLQETEGRRLQRIFSHNLNYFNQRDLSIRLRNIHRFLWDLSIRNLPCASVLVTNNRFTIDRLKTVYHKRDCFDLKPFAAIGNEVPLHGFFADKNVTGPKSSLLDNMLRKSQRDAHVIHALRLKDDRIIFIDEQEFLYGKLRNKLSKHVAQNTLMAYVSHISALKCQELATPLTKKRLAQLSKIDIDTYNKIMSMQKGYTHVLYITNVSDFHNALLKFGIYPEPSKE